MLKSDLKEELQRRGFKLEKNILYLKDALALRTEKGIPINLDNVTQSWLNEKMEIVIVVENKYRNARLTLTSPNKFMIEKLGDKYE